MSIASAGCQVGNRGGKKMCAVPFLAPFQSFWLKIQPDWKRIELNESSTQD
jgi:hypothetical protein